MLNGLMHTHLPWPKPTLKTNRKKKDVCHFTDKLKLSSTPNLRHFLKKEK